jgi:hypothetical protein
MNFVISKITAALFSFSRLGFNLLIFPVLVFRVLLQLFLFVSHPLIEPEEGKAGQHKEPIAVGNPIKNGLMYSDHKSDDHDGKEHYIKKSQPNLHVKSGLPALKWCKKKNPVSL